jgi:hypothetical protein
MARHARVNLSLIMRGIIAGGSTYDNCVPVAARARPKLLGGGATSDAGAFIRFIERRPAARVSQPSCRAASWLPSGAACAGRSGGTDFTRPSVLSAYVS